MKTPGLLAVPGGFMLLILFSGASSGFELIGAKWPTPATDMAMNFSGYNGGVSPSGTTWSQAYREAAQLWSDSTPFSFTLTDQSIDPCVGFSSGAGDDRNGTAFTSTLCGRSFGLGVLAVTITYAQVGGTETLETDMIFNASQNWDVYHGPWLSDASEFRRVAAHELGHVLGLDHEDDVPALMATFVVVGSTVETPLVDDIDGANFLYGNATAQDPLVLNLEEPTTGSVKTGVANIRGWAISSSALDRVELFVDGVSRGEIPSGGLRKDVASNFPTYPNASNSGYSMAFNYSNLSEGNHTILVRAFDDAGSSREFSANFTVVRFDNPFIQNASSVDLSNATVSNDQTSIFIKGLRADGGNYDVTLRWQTATQSYEIVDIR
ncbi:MAG: matrixin family metalloprotease [Gammaproteobacteria bacterium]|nr:matrixin family metalloprotease [Gammaproteobacteria bacterium]MCP5426192.1 matrixin family metalloprotease [Gammaproteobacteria bacterium]